jgi:hypothetical protein
MKNLSRKETDHEQKTSIKIELRIFESLINNKSYIINALKKLLILNVDFLSTE